MKSLLVVFVVALCQMGGSDVQQKLLLTVYYESECSDSRHFIFEQLLPAIILLGDYMELKLVPFGKAHSIKGDGNNGFHCQHGPTECLGNLMQDCALHHMQDRTDIERVSYVACEMDSLAGTTGNLMCVHNFNVPLDLVHNCVHSAKGVELQMDSEQATMTVTPQFIPSVTFDNRFDQRLQDDSQNNLIGALCSLLEDNEVCAAYYEFEGFQN